MLSVWDISGKGFPAEAGLAADRVAAERQLAVEPVA